MYDHVSLLAFDVRRTPLKDLAVETMTTNLGLPNIEEPGNLFREMGRKVDGVFLGIFHFFHNEDEANARVIHKAGLAKQLYWASALKHFAWAGWDFEVKNT